MGFSVCDHDFRTNIHTVPTCKEAVKTLYQPLVHCKKGQEKAGSLSGRKLCLIKAFAEIGRFPLEILSHFFSMILRVVTLASSSILYFANWKDRKEEPSPLKGVVAAFDSTGSFLISPLIKMVSIVRLFCGAIFHPKAAINLDLKEGKKKSEETPDVDL